MLWQILPFSPDQSIPPIGDYDDELFVVTGLSYHRVYNP